MSKKPLLGPIHDEDKLVRRPLSLHESTLERIENYMNFYEEVYGARPKFNLLVEEMVKAFISNDRGFQKFERDAEKSTQAKSLKKDPADKADGESATAVNNQVGTASESALNPGHSGY